jgi:hypothetical protein
MFFRSGKDCIPRITDIFKKSGNKTDSTYYKTKNRLPGLQKIEFFFQKPVEFLLKIYYSGGNESPCEKVGRIDFQYFDMYTRIMSVGGE